MGRPAVGCDAVGSKRGAAEWRRLVELYERSGETVKGFSERHGFSKAALEYWRRKFRSDVGGKFREYRLQAVDETPVEFEVKLANGRSVVIRGRVDETAIRHLLSIIG